eukprot:Platyproteum_vivax@DN8412_c0_g1_i1.p1
MNADTIAADCDCSLASNPDRVWWWGSWNGRSNQVASFQPEQRLWRIVIGNNYAVGSSSLAVYAWCLCHHRPHPLKIPSSVGTTPDGLFFGHDSVYVGMNLGVVRTVLQWKINVKKWWRKAGVLCHWLKGVKHVAHSYDRTVALVVVQVPEKRFSPQHTTLSAWCASVAAAKLTPANAVATAWTASRTKMYWLENHVAEFISLNLHWFVHAYGLSNLPRGVYKMVNDILSDNWQDPTRSETESPNIVNYFM